jgi:4-hydroxy-3-polyprenylbenzoate decarboxylase
MPCAIVLGGESVLPYSATAPLPPGISELLFAGFLNKGAIKLVKCKTIDMHVPANAEIVIEGTVSTQADGIGYDPREKDAKPLDRDHEVFEGPFGDHTGFYSLPDRYPIFTATAVTMREKPVYPTTIVGPPPQEDYYLGKATERIFLPLLKTLVPDILDYDLPMCGAFHNCAFIQIKKEYPLQARRVMHAIWGAGQMAWTKFIVVVDDDVDVHNHEQVLFHLCANVDPGRDLEVVHGPLDILDHAAPRLGAGQKLGVDATRKWPGEEVNGNPVRDWPTYLGTHQGMPDTIDAIVQQITSASQ